MALPAREYDVGSTLPTIVSPAGPATASTTSAEGFAEQPPNASNPVTRTVIGSGRISLAQAAGSVPRGFGGSRSRAAADRLPQQLSRYDPGIPAAVSEHAGVETVGSSAQQSQPEPHDEVAQEHRHAHVQHREQRCLDEQCFAGT